MYFVPVSPGSSEHSTYNRFTTAFVFTTRDIVWVWRFDQPGALVRVRMTVDGVPVTDWVAPDRDVYTFRFAVDNGHHVATPQLESGQQCVLSKPFLVNDTVAALPAELQRPWVALERIETSTQFVPEQVNAIGAKRPFALPMKPRTIVPYSERLPKNKLWARRWTTHQRNVKFRRFERTKLGDIIVTAEQKYSYGSAISLGEYKAGLVPPQFVVRDGPRNWGTLGYCCKFLLRRGGKGLYLLESDGRVAFMQFDAFSAPAGISMPAGGPVGGEGRIDTWAGWRVSEAGRVWEGGEAGWDYVGDWSRVPGIKRFHEPWGLAVAFRKPDGSIDNRDGLDLWVADTLNHRILFLDAWAAHPDVSSVTKRPAAALFPPAGYVTPSERGRAALVPFAGSADQAASEYVNEPWDCEVRPQDGKLYWSNFAGDSICRANLDGTGVERIVGGARPKTDSELGIPSRLYPSTQALATIRSWNLRDGSASEASCTRPQAIGFDANGDLIWVERYTYAIRKYTFATGMVTTLAQIPATVMSLTSSSSSTQDIAMAIDVDGTCGPKGDMFLSAWAHSCWRFAADGTYLGLWGFQSGKYARGGPFDLTDGCNYAWAVAVQEGRIAWGGNDSGSQFLEITKRLPTDPQPNEAQQLRGMGAWAPMIQTHGWNGYGELGLPNVEELALLDDARLGAYLTAHGVKPEQIADCIAWVRFTCVDYDTSGTPPADTLPPAAPTADLTIIIN